MLLLAGLTSTLWAAPDFPPREHGPLSLPAEKKDSDVATPKENVTPQSVRNNPTGEYALAEITVTILSGKDLNGSKAYKTDYKVVEIAKAEKMDPAHPAVRVAYKEKEDRNRYAVVKVEVTKSKTTANAYKIKAEVVETKAGDEPITPEVLFLN